MFSVVNGISIKASSIWFWLYYLDKKYEAAIDKYSEAINLNPTVAAYYANRSFAYFKTEAFGYAVADSDSAIKVDPSYIKVNLLKILNCKFEKKIRMLKKFFF